MAAPVTLAPAEDLEALDLDDDAPADAPGDADTRLELGAAAALGVGARPSSEGRTASKAPPPPPPPAGSEPAVKATARRAAPTAGTPVLPSAPGTAVSQGPMPPAVPNASQAPQPTAAGLKPPPPPPPGASKKVASVAAAPKGPKRRAWWEDFFSDDYLHSVITPPPAQVARQVDFIESSLGLAKGATVLDVGCGVGLHALELARRGYLVVGLDLSLPMITRAAEAAQQEGLRINFLHTDLREIAFSGMFDALICVGTTFGFFDDDTNRDVLGRLCTALKPGGKILLDVVNRDHVINSQPNLVWFEGDGCVVMEESDFNYFSSRLVVKRTMMREDGRQSETEYSIRMYALHELGQMMQQAGFRVSEVSGQEATRGVFFGAVSSRIILLGERRTKGASAPTASGIAPGSDDKPA
jgi:SAM-dependent methyltransferase